MNESNSSNWLLSITRMKFLVIGTLIVYLVVDFTIANISPSKSEIKILRYGIQQIFSEYDGYKTSSVRLGEYNML